MTVEQAWVELEDRTAEWTSMLDTNPFTSRYANSLS
jgi:hypothetical protein